MYVDHYSGTFYSLITRYKKKYLLISTDQAEYYFESLFLLFIQTVFSACIIASIEKKKLSEYVFDYQLNLCIFFTTMILHFGSIYTIRNGMQMCKYVVYHWEEFDNPIAAFLLGFLVANVNIFCAMANIMQSLSVKDVSTAIRKFVAFKILI